MDELDIELLRELVINVKEQLDKTVNGNQSTITRPKADTSRHLDQECELIKGDPFFLF